MTGPQARRHPDTGAGQGILPLDRCLQEYLKTSGIEFLLKHPGLHLAWVATVGEQLAAHARVAGYSRGAIEIAVDSSSLMHEIQFHRAALLADLQAQVKNPFISRIKFRVVSRWEEDDKEENRQGDKQGE